MPLSFNNAALGAILAPSDTAVGIKNVIEDLSGGLEAYMPDGIAREVAKAPPRPSRSGRRRRPQRSSALHLVSVQGLHIPQCANCLRQNPPPPRKHLSHCHVQR